MRILGCGTGFNTTSLVEVCLERGITLAAVVDVVDDKAGYRILVPFSWGGDAVETHPVEVCRCCCRPIRVRRGGTFEERTH